LGRDARATELYRNGIELLLARHTVTGGNVKRDDRNLSPMERMLQGDHNVGAFEKYFPSLRYGFLASATERQARDLFDSQRAALESDLGVARAAPAGQAKRLGEFPRVLQRSALLRELGLRFGFLDDVQKSDTGLLAAFP